MKQPPIRLSKRQVYKLSDITSDIALLSLASIVLPSILDRIEPSRVVLGLVATLVLWFISVWLQK